MKALIKHKLAVAQYGTTNSEQQDSYLHRKRAADACYSSNNRLQYYIKKLSEHDTEYLTAVDNGHESRADTLASFIKQDEDTIVVAQVDFDADQSVHEQLTGEKWTGKRSIKAKTNHLTADERAEMEARMSLRRAS